MTATLTAPRRTRKPRPAATRPVTEVLLELAYHMHATKVIVRPQNVRSADRPTVVRG